MIHRLKNYHWIGLSWLLMAFATFAADGGHTPTAADVVDIKPQMILWTWVVFILFYIVLYKLGFKPIMGALDKREESIRTGLQAADEAREELAQIDSKREQIIGEAEAHAKTLIEESRKAAREAAQVIEDKARDEAQILLDNAKREIASATDSARANLRKESAELSLQLAAKILDDNLDEARSKALVDKLITEI